MQLEGKSNRKRENFWIFRACDKKKRLTIRFGFYRKPVRDQCIEVCKALMNKEMYVAISRPLFARLKICLAITCSYWPFIIMHTPHEYNMHKCVEASKCISIVLHVLSSYLVHILSRLNKQTTKHIIWWFKSK